VFVSILHADLDSFFASVEQRDDPRLRGRPTIVGGGVVLAASYEAKARGVYTPMGLRKARESCPDAIVVPPRFDAYTQASKDVFRVFDDLAPVVEGLSIDEAFLDVSGMERSVGTPLQIAHTLRARVREEVGLPITVGIARTKFLAKAASALAKPDGMLVVPPEGELAFLHPLPVERVWGIGAVTAAKLRACSIETVGELACVPEPVLAALLGRAAARQLHALANNVDPRPVRPRRRRRSIGAQHALGRARRSPEEIDVQLLALVDRVTRRLRASRRVGRTVTLRLRFDDFSRATRSHTLPHSTAQTQIVLAAARSLFNSALPMIDHRGLTLIGVAITNLVDDLPMQLCLPLDRDEGALLDAALDEIRSRFGSSAVTRAALLGRPTELTMPLLPD
jgi:DNA polymerase-4